MYFDAVWNYSKEINLLSRSVQEHEAVGAIVNSPFLYISYLKFRKIQEDDIGEPVSSEH